MTCTCCNGSGAVDLYGKCPLCDGWGTLEHDPEDSGLAIRRVGIIGLGPHNRRIYYPQLEHRRIEIAIVVDLEGQRKPIDEFLEKRKSHPETFVWIPDEYRNNTQVHPSAEVALESARLDGLIISSEPSAHQPYLRWALKHNIDVLIDKPPIIPSPFSLTPEAARDIISQFDEVLEMADSSSANVTVTVQRRAHPGYCFVYNLLSDFVRCWKVPISYIDIYHADGMWCMPGEMCSRSYHPYKYGYGKLMHSGYHFLDLLMWLHGINETHVKEKAGNQFELYCRRFGAGDLLHQYSADDLKRLTGASNTDIFQSFSLLPADLTEVGEQNLHSLLQFFNDSSGAVSCTASLNLMQNSFSRRSWFEPKKDLYKGNGRVRHERLVVQVGTLMTVHVHSYQSHEVNCVDPPAPENGTDSTRELLRNSGLDPDAVPAFNTAGYGHGHDEHFDVVVYRNTAVVGGAPIETIPVGLLVSAMEAGRQGYLGHNEHGRERLLVDWLCGTPDGGLSPLKRQRPTMLLLSRLYEMLALNRQSASELEDVGDTCDDDVGESSQHVAPVEMPASYASRYELHREISRDGYEVQSLDKSLSPRKSSQSPSKVHHRREKRDRTLSQKIEHWNMISSLTSPSEIPKILKAMVFLGGPGSGKGTQANLLVERKSFSHLDFGQTVRNALRHKTTVGQRILASGEYGPGKFLGPKLVFEVMEEAAARLRNSTCNDTWALLDGCPRNVEQAEHMKAIGLDVRLAVYLHAPEDILLRRVDGRLIHPASGRTYHPVFRPPVAGLTDDVTGEPLEERKLDKIQSNAEAFRNRMSVEFHQNVVPLIEWYRKNSVLVEIDAAGPIETIYKAVCDALDEQSNR